MSEENTDLNYSKGYAAGMRRVNKLKAEIQRLRVVKPARKDEAVEYLLCTAESFMTAGRLLIEMSLRNELPTEQRERKL